MPEKTDAEWQALDARIAREVMGLKQACIDGDLCWVTPAFNYRYLVCDSAILRIEPEYKVWQPHKDVAQALMAADKICDQGWDRELQRLGNAQRTYASFWRYDPFDPQTLGSYADSDAPAICLAIEKWLDAQGDGASGQTDSATHRRDLTA